MKVELLVIYGGTIPFFEVEDVRCVQISPKEQERGNGIAWFGASLYPTEDGKIYVSLRQLPTIITIEKDGTLWIGETFLPTKPLWIRGETDEK